MINPEIIKKEIKIETFRSGKPGGQRRDKKETAVRITHLPTGLQAEADERFQSDSKKVALERLIGKLERKFRPRKRRIPTKVPKYIRRKRLREKKQHSDRKQLRKKPTLE